MIDLMIAAQDAVAAAAQTAGDAVMETADALAQTAPAAQTAVETAKSVSIGFWELFMEGGWLMWVLVALAGVMIFIFVERFVAIRKATRIDDNFMNRIRDYIWEGKINSAVDLCRRTDSPVARMIEKGIERIGRPMGDIQTSIENVANLEVAKLEKGLPTLATIAGGAPMIGFLGTVVGMVEVFISMSANTAGGINIGDLSSGMYTAMVTTVGGLIVGIPAYFAHNYLVARIEKLVFHMEATSIAFMDILNQPVQNRSTMAIKRSSKVSTQFSASSMTDLVFLLLIFMVLATTMINPNNAVKLTLPSSSSEEGDPSIISLSVVPSTEVASAYVYTINGDEEYATVDEVRTALASHYAKYAELPEEEKPFISLRCDEKVTVDALMEIVDITRENKYKMVVATKQKH